MYPMTFLSFILRPVPDKMPYGKIRCETLLVEPYLRLQHDWTFYYIVSIIFLTVPFDSLRPLLNKATWKCPFVLGGTTITIFFLVFTWCTVCVFINDAVIIYLFFTHFEHDLKRMVLNWMLPSVFVLPTETRRDLFPASDGAKGKKFLSSIRAVPVFICIMQLNLYKRLFVIKL